MVCRRLGHNKLLVAC